MCYLNLRQFQHTRVLLLVIFLPMNKSSLGIHKIKLMVQTSPSFSNSCSVWQHANCAWHLGQISTGNNSWRLVVDTNFETSRTPIYELDASLGLDLGCKRIVMKDKKKVLHEKKSIYNLFQFHEKKIFVFFFGEIKTLFVISRKKSEYFLLPWNGIENIPVNRYYFLKAHLFFIFLPMALLTSLGTTSPR